MQPPAVHEIFLRLQRISEIFICCCKGSSKWGLANCPLHAMSLCLPGCVPIRLKADIRHPFTRWFCAAFVVELLRVPDKIYRRPVCCAWILLCCDWLLRGSLWFPWSADHVDLSIVVRRLDGQFLKFCVPDCGNWFPFFANDCVDWEQTTTKNRDADTKWREEINRQKAGIPSSSSDSKFRKLSLVPNDLLSFGHLRTSFS